MHRTANWKMTVTLLLLTGMVAATPIHAKEMMEHPAPPRHAAATFATHDTDPTPTIAITFPAMDARVTAGEALPLTVNLQGLTLAPDAHHVHVWVDDQPYKAMYDATVPFPIEGLAPGWHSIRVAPSRPWHELYKNDGAFAWVNFQVGDSDTVHSRIDDSLPILTYSRPKKNLDHTWEASRNLITDWYLTGATLGEDGVYLRLTFDGVSYLITSWAPIFVEHPMPGEHTLTLELMKDGAPLEANFSPFTATFTVQPKGEMAPAAAGHH